MKRVTRNGVIAVAAASGAMALAVPAFADSAADGSATGSPGVVSGNTIQLPVHVPVNVCGNTVNVAGLLNPAAGNRCANEDGAKEGGAHRGGAHGGATHNGGVQGGGGHGGAVKNPDGPPAGAVAQGGGKDSPGVLSGNGVQLPIHLPVNLSGNSVSVVGVGNPSVGNESGNTSGDHLRGPVSPTPEPPTPSTPHPGTGPGVQVEGHHTPPAAEASLAHTGADNTIPAAVTSAALLLGGAALYRRFRPRVGR
ncbi:chaplin [Streptomyces sp. NPDC088350]|uniref:chaplin n=1 Tax=Streptomyces sp. NPDC088350 TaxID=3365854 RepID=UPI0038282D6E